MSCLMNTTPLTSAELDRLPNGARVRVLWAGSREARAYELRRDGFGTPRVYVPGAKGGPGLPLESVGTSERETRVWQG